MNRECDTKVRVAFVTTSSDFGGAELLLQELVLRLDRSRFVPHVLSLLPLGRVGREIRDAGVSVHSLNLAEVAKVTELPGAAWSVASYFRRNEIDLVHAQLYRANVLSCLASRLIRSRPRVVFSQHSLYAMTGAKAEWMARRTAPLADRIVAVSPEVASYVKREMGARNNQVVMIPNGVDGTRFEPGRHIELRSELGYNERDFVIGCVGRLSHEKGIDLLLEAVGQLYKVNPHIRLCIVGDGPMRSELQTASGVLGLSNCVQFLGARSDVPALYRVMDLFALPSRREASPMALLEAMASRLPIVATRVGGVAGVAGEVAIVIEPESVEALESGLSQLMSDSATAEKLAEAARARFEEAFSIDQTVARHEALYLDLLSDRLNRLK